MIDAAFVEQALRADGVLPEGGTVTSVDGRDVGFGQVGHCVRYAIKYAGDAAHAPASIVGKFPSDDPTSRATGIALGNYEREVRFYEQLAPALTIRVPHCFHAEFDPATSDFVLLLEDMAPSEQGDQLAGCSVDIAASALEQIARMHIAHWGDESLADLPWLQQWSGPGAQMVQGMYLSVWEGFVGRYGDVLDDEQLALGAGLGPVLAATIQANTGPFTLTHGDYRLDNMLIAADAATDPEGVCVVDWQSPGRGPALGDVAYFLGNSLTTDDRRAAERDLVRSYYDRLVGAGIESYPWDRCWEDYRRAATGGVVMSVVASMIVGAHDRGDAMFRVMADRHLRAMADLDAADLLGG
jgi:hypothetical protein